MNRCMDGTALKYIALLTMVMDHIAASLLKAGGVLAFGPYAEEIGGAMRALGRLSFPVFAFLLVEGFFHTGSRIRYLGRLWLFAVLSEVPFDLALHGKGYDPLHQSILLTLSISFTAMYVMEEIRRFWPDVSQGSLQVILLFVTIVSAYAGELLHCDYGWRGVVLILVFYFFYYYRIAGLLAGAVAFSGNLYALPAFLLLFFYSGKKGESRLPRYFFYIFYPAHLLLLWLIGDLLLN